MNVIDWPDDLWTQLSWSWSLEGVTSSFGPGFNGRSNVFFTENRVWRGSVTLGKIWGQTIPKHRSFINSLKGRSSILRVRVCNPHHETGAGTQQEFLQRVGFAAADISQGYLPFSSGDPFSDMNGFDLPTGEAPTSLRSAAAGSTTLIASGFLANFMGAGLFFSINDHLYEVASVDGRAITFHPPLREGVAPGDVMNLSPTVLVRLAGDAEGQISQVGGRIAGPVTVSFEEVFQR